MQARTLIPFALFALAAGAAADLGAQCELYYKFDRGVGTAAVNYGTLALDSRVVKPTAAPASPWSPGQFGGGLRGSAYGPAESVYCDTGWKGGATGDITISWWSKQRVTPSTLASYAFGGIGSWRCFTGGVAGTGMWMRSWGGADLQYPGNFKNLAAGANGVALALTIDSTARTAQWYTDGVPTGAAITITGGMNVAAGTSSFNIGKQTSDTATYPYDVDEFRLCMRVASAAEIKAWHTLAHAAAGGFGKSCGITLAGSGVPTAGNALFGLDIKGPAGGMGFLLVAGVTPQVGFDMGVAFPVLTGCTWYPQFLVEVPGQVSGGGVKFPTPVPASGAGAAVEVQLLGFDTGSKALMSNALTIKVEKQ